MPIDFMAMLVKTRVAPSGIHGNGLFAAEPIPAGTPIWRFAAGFDQEFTPAFWSGLPELARTHGKTDAEKSQAPIVYEGNAHDFVITHNAAIRAIAHRTVNFANGKIASIETNPARKPAASVTW